MNPIELEYAAWRQHPLTRDVMDHLESELSRLRSACEHNAVNGDADKSISFAQQAFAINSTIKWVANMTVNHEQK